MSDVIRAVDLVKKFGEKVAVDHISFNVAEGECFGFLGPNGAGKTTTMRMVFGFSPPSGGSLEVFGLPIRSELRKIKGRIGVVPQENSLDPDLSVLQNLLIYAHYYDLPRPYALQRAEELLTFFHLQERTREPIDRLSGGMKRRLLIARALMNRPQLLILDEPTTGLDPQSRHAMWERIRDLKSQRVTCLLTTHYMEEADQLCDRLVIIDLGRVIEEGHPKELIKKHGVANLEEAFLKLTGKELRD